MQDIRLVTRKSNTVVKLKPKMGTGIAIPFAFASAGLGLAAGDILGEKIGQMFVQENGLQGMRAARAQERIKRRITNCGIVAGTAWGALLGLEVDASGMNDANVHH